MLVPVPVAVLPRGQVLYHGTDCRGDYSVPDGPAWFALRLSVALRWAGWATPPPGRTQGKDKRVLQVQATAPLRLFDVRARLHLARLSELFWGPPDANSYQLALALRDAGQVGWLGRSSGCGVDEVLICRPGECLVGTRVHRDIRARPFPSVRYTG